VLAASEGDNADDFSRKLENIIGRNRDGNFFTLDKQSGKVEFGSAAKLVTKLETNAKASDVIAYWLKDVERVAASLWKKEMMLKLEKDTYRLEVIKVQFVTIQLAPSVDVRMRSCQQSFGPPTFQLESISFDPNVQVLPGIGLSAEQLGIEINVVGELGVSSDGLGLEGTIGFVTSGILPPPLRFLPSSLLEGAADTINREVVNFALENFQLGARREYALYREEVKRQFEARASQ
jgi:hypothetical protein